MKSVSNHNLEQYSGLMKALHWTMAFFIFTLLCAGFSLDFLTGPTKGTVMMLHKSCGIITLVLLVIRIIVRLFSSNPSAKGTKAMKVTARVTVLLLYVLMTAMVLSGYLMSSFGGWPITFFDAFALPQWLPVNLKMMGYMHDTHVYAAFTLVGLIGLHIAGALYHRFVVRDDVMGRMLPVRMIAGRKKK